MPSPRHSTTQTRHRWEASPSLPVDPKHPYYVADHPQHAAAVEEVRAAFQRAYPEQTSGDGRLSETPSRETSSESPQPEQSADSLEPFVPERLQLPDGVE
jgi:hypothetical protein